LHPQENILPVVAQKELLKKPSSVICAPFVFMILLLIRRQTSSPYVSFLKQSAKQNLLRYIKQIKF